MWKIHLLKIPGAFGERREEGLCIGQYSDMITQSKLSIFWKFTEDTHNYDQWNTISCSDEILKEDNSIKKKNYCLKNTKRNIKYLNGYCYQ